MTVQRCQRETTSTEFLEWQEYFAAELGMRKPEHYYLAQIAMESVRPHVKKGVKLKLEDFLLSFKTPEPEKPLTEAEIQARIARSKAAWFGANPIPKEGQQIATNPLPEKK